MIKALRDENNAYDEKITFVNVDWDLHGRAPISREHRVSSRSTLILLTPNGEAGRIVAQTSKEAIKGLLDKAP